MRFVLITLWFFSSLTIQSFSTVYPTIVIKTAGWTRKTKFDNSVKVNKATVTRPDVADDNGVIHIIGIVLFTAEVNA